MKFTNQSWSCHAEPFASLKGKLSEASLLRVNSAKHLVSLTRDPSLRSG